MEEFDKKLEQYGILTKNAQKSIEKDRVKIFNNAIIETINFKTLQEKGIKELHIKKSEIYNIVFSKKNDISVCFDECLILKQINAEKLLFKNKFNFIKCIFHEKIDFSYSFFSTTCIEENVSFKECTFKFNVFFNETRFETHVNFEESTFEKQVIFNNAFFLNQETEINYIEVSFLGAIFKDRAYFYNITFKSMIDFSYAIFENEVRFCNTYFESVVHFSFTKFKGVCNFSNTKFLATQKKEERNRICFDDTEFEDIVHFYSAKFESKVLFCKSVFKSKVNFNGAEFSTSHYDDAEINNFDNVTFESDAWFNDIIFNSSVLFSKCEYKGNIYMRNITSKQQLYFYESLFLSNVYFNNSHFKDYVSFCECEFEKTACFYGVKFDKTPNFSQAIFKGNLNVVNTNLNFTFDDLQERIKQEYEDFNKNIENKKPLDKFANDFRDSFRIFKSALIKDNNLLDASNFHKYELYCKEIELKQNWDKKGENVKNTTDLEKNVSRIRDFMDFLLLGFYRKLCDHHTDFLKVFNNLILLIALYALFIFVGSFEFDLEKKSIQNLNKTSDMFSYLTKVKEVIINFSFMQQYYNHILISFVAVCFICLIVIFYKIFKNIKLDFIIIKNIIFKDIIKSILILCVYLLFLLIILIYINIYIPKNQNNLNILSNIGIFFTFCIFYLWMVCLNTLFLRYIFICISYIIVIISMGANITILNPFIGKLINDKIFSNDPLFIYLTFAYTILIFLVLFSLQKTARKNSIVPS